MHHNLLTETKTKIDQTEPTENNFDVGGGGDTLLERSKVCGAAWFPRAFYEYRERLSSLLSPAVVLLCLSGCRSSVFCFVHSERSEECGGACCLCCILLW